MTVIKSLSPIALTTTRGPEPGSADTNPVALYEHRDDGFAVSGE
jgi:hypothetical protein